MSISVKCHGCGKTLKAPDSAGGKRAKCPQCATTVEIPEPIYDAEAVDADESADGGADPFAGIDSYDSPAAPTDEIRKPCPLCGEMIVAGAAKCRFWGEVFDAKLKRSGTRSGKSKSRTTLADPGKRFVGALADGLATLVILGPGIALIGAGGGISDEPGVEPEPLAVIGALLFLLGLLIVLALQIYLLSTRSQSIGKNLVKTQIIDYETNEPANFVKCFLLRGVANWIICIIPCIGPIYSLVDLLCVFGEEHRCLHDRLAGTSVVDIS